MAAYADLCNFQLRDAANTMYNLPACYDEFEYDHTVSGITAFNGRPVNQVWTLWAEGSNTSGENVTAWYLTIYYTATPTGPTAGFTQDATEGALPLTVNFTDTSDPGTESITDWAWNFGDPESGALNTSTLQNPSHVYANVGTYTVELSVTTSVDSDTETKADLITVVVPEGPTADFSQDTASGPCALDGQFHRCVRRGDLPHHDLGLGFRRPGQRLRTTPAHCRTHNTCTPAPAPTPSS